MSLHATGVWYYDNVTVSARDSYAPDTTLPCPDKTWLSIDHSDGSDGVALLLSTAQLRLIRDALNARLAELATRIAGEVPV